MIELIKKLAKADPSSLLSLWKILSPYPGGKKLFSFILGKMVPYTSSIHPNIQQLQPGLCIITINDKKKLRNHLSSIHAIALANIGEASTGLAVITAIPPNMRAILVKISIEYYKKSRGTITATAKIAHPIPAIDQTLQVEGKLTDTSGNLVAAIFADWKISPVRNS